MRTNIVIDDSLIKTAMELSGLNTKKAVVDEALRLFVKMKKQLLIKNLRGQLKWEGNLDQMRGADDHS